MNYEFHITSTKSRILGLNSGYGSFDRGVPILAVDNLDRDGHSIREDWMTCIREDIPEGHARALGHIFALQEQFGFRKHTRCAPIRKKIEVQWQPDCDPEEYLYIEAHFDLEMSEAGQKRSGISRNLISGKVIATERCYDPAKFHSFAKTHSNQKVELCLFDDGLRYDGEEKWIPTPKSPRIISEKSRKSMSSLLGNLLHN